MKIGLIAVDSNHPNLALMKISAWHKNQSDSVGWYNPFDQYDMARWAMRREIYTQCDFKDYEPRKGFKCREYFT